jgi:2-polyprenyl-3-methyl-5-hydroxy-6-metoxy-1,4-benzoquinol methylase
MRTQNLAEMSVNAIEQCPVCGDTSLRPYAMSPYDRANLHFGQVRCDGCRLLISQPQADAERMASYYKSEYFEANWPDPDALWRLNREAYARFELPILKSLWRDWPPPAGAEVVEVGCGYGAMLGTLRDQGFRVSGCEPSMRAIEVARSHDLNVMQGNFPDLPLPHSSFDLVLSMHVIEHLADPAAFVRELTDLARPGGLIAIVTEDAWTSQYAYERFVARLAGRLPAFRSSTDHTFVFQADHLTTFLQRAGCDDVRARSFSHRPVNESLHWRMYKGMFRNLDRLLGHGEYLAAVGRRALSS